jgi:hypothetical protein
VNGSIKSRKLLIPVSLAIFICSWFLLCVSSFVVVGFFNFVPSAEWLAETNLFRTIAGSLSATLFVWVFWKGGRRLGVSKLKRLGTIITSPFVGYFVGGNILLIWPMLLPIFAGHEVALPFTVQKANDYGGGICRAPVHLEDMPFLVARVCNVPDSIRSTISPGNPIVVRGWGTRLGVYAREVRLADVNGPRF